MTETGARSSSDGRFAFIHGLRGIAAMLVVWSHLGGFWNNVAGTPGTLYHLWDRWVLGPFHLSNGGSQLGVVLFFLISGFIITHTSLREDHTQFGVKRVMRIFPPLFLATIISYALLVYARNSQTRMFGVNDGSLKHWLASLLLVDGYMPEGRALEVTWTLVIELMFYAITFALIASSRLHPARATRLMLGIWVLAVLVAMNTHLLGVQNSGLPLYVSFLILGRVIYLVKLRLIAFSEGVVLAALISALFYLFSEYSNPGFLFGAAGGAPQAPVVSYVLAILVFLLAMRVAPKRLVPPFKLLGDVSYSLYLIHIPIGITVLNALERWNVPISVASVIAVLVSVAAAWVAFRLVEVPSQVLARRVLAWRSQRKAEAAPLAADA